MIDFNAGQPIGPTQIEALFEKIQGMCDALSQTSRIIGCVPVNGTVSDGECITLENPLSSGFSEPGVNDKKLVVLTVQPSLSFNQTDNSSNTFDSTTGNATVTDSTSGGAYYNVVAQCLNELTQNNTVLWSSGDISDPRSTSVQFTAECARDDVFQICVETGLTGAAPAATDLSKVSFCGFILCIGDVERDLDGLFKPPPTDNGCCYGREHLYLASQNLDAICQSLINNRDQLVSCDQASSNDTEPLLISGNLATETQYVIFGYVELCVINTRDDLDIPVTVQPVVGCQSNPIECTSEFQVIRRADNPTEVCIRVPVNACGTCPAGDSIFGGFYFDEDCDNSAITNVGDGLEIVSATQNYCTWLFTLADVSALPAPTDLFIGKCLFDTNLLPMQEKCEIVEPFIENRTQPNCTVRDLGSFTGTDGGEYIIQEALPWPPLDDPTNTDPPPIKKWNITIQICSPRILRFDYGQPQRVTVTMSVDVKCGGTVLASASEQWLAFQIGGTEIDQVIDFAPRCITINQCVECAIDEDLVICTNGEVNANQIYPLNMNVLQAEMFCF